MNAAAYFRLFSVSIRSIRYQGGATAIEYAFVAGLISIAAVVGFTTIGTNLSTIFNHVASSF
jgi:pilus assembly protein Flp/PilA